MSAFCGLTKARILIGLMCFSFLLLSVRWTAKSCSALETEKAHENHLHVTQDIVLCHSLLPHVPLEHRCSCAFSINSCCMDGTYNTGKNFHATLSDKDTFRRLSVPQATMIRPVDPQPIGGGDRDLSGFDCLDQKESFLVNCTFLI